MSTTLSERPTYKLSIAFTGMCVLCMKGALPYCDFGWVGWVMAVATATFTIWLLWFGIFRTSGMQLLWGWAFLVAAVYILAAQLMGWLPATTRFVRILPDVLNAFAVGWLLVVDRDVARYRTHLKKLENERSKLRLED